VLQLGETVDRYRVRTRLGEGGMAIVYLVEHVHLKTLHALKVHTSTKKSIKRRFAREGRLQARLHHPNVVRVTDVIDLGEHAGLVMEYVDGPSMSALLRRYRPPLPDAVAMFRGLALGMGHAHEQGLVHRDLKPSNVLIALRRGEMRAKLTDFGLAKSLVEEADVRTRTGATLGTPAYMSPEQIRDASKVDHRADIYGLGCLLYALTCGRPPFRGSDVLELLDRIEERDYADPRKAVHTMPDRLATLIDDLLHPEPEGRPQDVRELVDRLDGALQGEISPQTLSVVRGLRDHQRTRVAQADAEQAKNRSAVSQGQSQAPPRTLGAAPDKAQRQRIRSATAPFDLKVDMALDAAQALSHLLATASGGGEPYRLVIVDDGVRGGLLEKRIQRDPRLKDCVVVRADQVSGGPDELSRVVRIRLAELRGGPRAVSVPDTAKARPTGSALVIEDNRVQRALLGHVLRRIGYEFVDVETLAHAREQLRTRGFDIILVDVHLPDGDGIALIEELRASGNETPILVLTADTAPDVKARATESTLVGFLQKPVRTNDLDTALSRMRQGGRAATAPVVDPAALDRLADALGGDEGAVDDLISLFVGDVASERGAWQDAVHHRSLGALVELAHRLQPAAAHLGAIALVEACDELTQRADRLQWTEVETRVDELLSLIDRTADALAHMRARRHRRVG